MSADSELPTAIWNAAVREELRSKVLARLRRYNLVQAGSAGSSAVAKAGPLAGKEEDEMAWLNNFRLVGVVCRSDKSVDKSTRYVV